MGNKLTKQEVQKQEMQTKEPKKSTFQKLLARFQIRPNKPENVSSKQASGENKLQSPPPKPPLRIHTERMLSKSVEPEEATTPSEWTDVPLQVPESPPKINGDYNVKITPVPPPRKHKIKLQKIPDTPKIFTNFEGKSDYFQEIRIPVEEPIIIKQKVVEHVCDGTHRHVRNTINGKVVDEIIPLTDKELKQTKSTKTASTLSLPSYNNLKKKDEKRATSPTKSSKKNSSASSLPTDKKSKLTHSAAEKIESYMISRCKSFGSIIPHSKSEKPKSHEQFSDKESVDSWSGLEDWDVGIIEHDILTELPKTPLKNKVKQRINEIPLNNKGPQSDNMKINTINSIKPDTKEFDELLSNMDEALVKSPVARNSFQCEVKRLPDCLPASVEIKPSPSSPARGSYPFKLNSGKSAFENDAFFTTEFLQNERNCIISDTNKTTQTKQAPLATFDSDKESEKDGTTDKSVDEVDSRVSVRTKEIIAPTEKRLEFVKETVSPAVDKSAPKLIPRRKSSSGHSKLLKFIKDSNEQNISENKTITKTVDDSNTHNVNKTETLEKIDEPEIVPTLKEIDSSWNNLLQRHDVNNVKLLEQESTISDLVDTSSDDTRSTTIETSFK